MASPDLVSENIQKIAALFPSCVTETAEGKAIDFDLLKQELNHAVVEGNKERYRLEWPGKREAIVTANIPTTKTLRPIREDSVDFDNTENIYIEGDNLEVLKLLQESYLGKIKMIYIDPPYNTGKDFVYKDNFTVKSEEWKEKSGDYDEYKQRLVANPETAGRYHSDWLSMVYPRLKLARNLLKDDGVIFISIDDNEVHNLRKICDEIFGEENLLAQFVWRTDGNFDNQAKVKYCHEFILSYCKKITEIPHPPTIDPNIDKNSKLFKSEIRNTIVKNGPANPVSQIELPVGFPADFDRGSIKTQTDTWPKYLNDAKIIGGKLQNKTTIESGWSSKDLALKFIRNEMQPIVDGKGQETRFILSKTGALEVVKKRSESQSHVISVISGVGNTQAMSAKLRSEGIFFDYPKPINLHKYLISMNTGKDFTILDFFSGSATMAEALIDTNKEDGGKRKYIMVQLPEATDEKSEAYQDGYKNICEIGKERIRRAAKKISEELKMKSEKGGLFKDHISDLDLGFRVFRLDSSNMQDVYYRPQDYIQEALDLFADNLKPDRTPDDLLAQVMLDWGLPLSLTIAQFTILGKKVYKVAENSLYACFDKGIDEEFAKEIAKDKPLRIVLRDNGFKDDTAKTNVRQLLKQLNPETEMKVI
jgi:adenine-specific DNA-methyltransferase